MSFVNEQRKNTLAIITYIISIVNINVLLIAISIIYKNYSLANAMRFLIEFN